jgi:hypothetical protein
VLTDERLTETQAIGQDDRFTVFAKNVAIAARWRMNGLREEAER